MRLVNIAALLVIIICPVLANAEQATDLRVTASPWSPYVSRDLPGYGIAVSIVTTVLKRAGYKPSFALEQWPKDLEGTRLGEYDLIASIWFTDDRARELVFSEPIFENRIKLLVRTDSDIQLSMPEALKGYRIGVVEDYAYTQGAYKNLPVEIVKATVLEENLQNLLAGDIEHKIFLV